jgi:hypothetical protein
VSGAGRFGSLVWDVLIRLGSEGGAATRKGCKAPQDVVAGCEVEVHVVGMGLLQRRTSASREA